MRNNIYVKNFPASWDEKMLKELFGQYGEIQSTMIQTDPKINMKYAFICYGLANEEDRQKNATYGAESANKAIQNMHDREFENMKIYVQPALTKSEREKRKL